MATSTSVPFVAVKKKKGVIKDTDLCDFAVTELIHDFKSIEPGIGEPKINGISPKRYSKNKENFHKILADGLNGCANVNLIPSNTFIKYTEPEILAQITGANFKANIKNNTLNDKVIIISNGFEYKVKITSKTEINESSPGTFDDSECGIKLFDNLFDTTITPTPILLIDVDMGITKYLKTGNNGTTARKVYMFSPVVVRADSATKMNLTDTKSLKTNFLNTSGIDLINVIDIADFSTAAATTNTKSDDFFSKYTIKSYENGEKIDQDWSGFSKIGTGSGANKVLTRSDVNKTNNRTNVAKKIDPIINISPGTDVTGPNNMIATTAIAEKNREIFNSEIQSKRSGDWLPVIYILNYNSASAQLKTYSNPIVPTQISFTAPSTFEPTNMYIVTNDTPLVAFALYSGVNIILINDGKFISLTKVN